MIKMDNKRKYGNLLIQCIKLFLVLDGFILIFNLMLFIPDKKVFLELVV
jgi:hypothetical protein